MNTTKNYILLAVVVIIIVLIYFIDSRSVNRSSGTEVVTVTPRIAVATKDSLSPEVKAKRFELAKEITTPDGFINTDNQPITISDYIGKKVILIDFWTYSCINCQRTTPYLNSWYEKYSDKGFVIIGVHTPEFEFEKNYDNVKAAVEKFGIKFPVVLDNDYSTWNAYNNRYWPRKYLIDIDGYIVYDHIGEGAYEETEQKIRDALAERLALLGEDSSLDVSLTKETSTPGGARSPETYFGSARNKEQSKFLFPINSWQVAAEYAQNVTGSASIVFTYTAQDVFFVAESDSEIIVEVLLDDKPLGQEAGADIERTVEGKTLVRIKEARLYKLIEGNESVKHTLKLIIEKAGLRAYTFTFG